MFLKNAWYVAGWSREFDRSLSARKILGDNIVFYRKRDGEPVALEDACPHRKLPLSQGQIRDDEVICGYHGLAFDGSGACSEAPTQRGQTPRRARVQSYPVVDRYRFTWIWMGDPELADPGKIVDVPNFDNEDWGYTDGGSMDFSCNYLWIADNLLDPSHVAWVHVSSFGGAGTDDGPLELDRSDHSVTVYRWIYDQPPSPYYAPLLKFSGHCDRLQHYEMRYPANAVNMSVYTPVGSGGPDRPHIAKTYVNISYNFLTPIDDDTTRYFWFQHRNTDGRDREISERMNAGAVMAFTEDKQVLEEVHKGMKAMKTPNIDLGLDAGAKLFRSGLQKKIDAESGETPATAD